MEEPTNGVLFADAPDELPSDDLSSTVESHLATVSEMGEADEEESSKLENLPNLRQDIPLSDIEGDGASEGGREDSSVEFESPCCDFSGSGDSQEEAGSVELKDQPSKKDISLQITHPSGLRRRRSTSDRCMDGIPGKDAQDDLNLEAESVVISESSLVHETAVTSGEEMYKSYQEVEENEKSLEESDSSSINFISSRDLNEQIDDNSTFSFPKERVDDSFKVESPGEVHGSSHGLLGYITGLVIKSVGFQFNLLFGLLTFPGWLAYYSFAFVFNPFGTAKRGRDYLLRKLMGIWSIVGGTGGSFIRRRSNEYKSFLKLALQFSWGLLWAAYVSIVLLLLLVGSFIASGLLVRWFIAEPVQMKAVLNFDYTESSPVAFFPLSSCSGISCGVNCGEKIDVGKGHDLQVIPPSHKFGVSVSLTLPESNYNRNLGIFQVRVDCLSANGIVLASSRQPTMLTYKSKPIRLLSTSFKILPVLTGYTSESQTLNVKVTDFIEGQMATACLRVVIEQRAEFQSGAGIPEIYDASLFLESELPLLRRILWQWKKTLFVWVGLMMFMMQLLFTLICCTPIIIPRPPPRVGSAANDSPQNSFPVGNPRS